MIHIILLILKIIGIILLVLLGLVLAAVLAVLFAPVRYRAEGAFRGNAQADGRITWLFPLVSVNLSLRGGALSSRLRVLGIPLGGGGKRGRELEEDLEELAEPFIHTASLDGEGKETPPPQPDDGTETVPSGNPKAEPPPDAPQEPDQAGNGTSGETEKKEPKQKPYGPSGVSGRPGRGISSLARRLKAVLSWPARFLKGFKKRIRRIQKRFKAIRGRLRELAERKDQVLAFLKDEENRKTFRLAKRQLARVFRHIRPRRFRGQITFGFDDPYRTGQALSAAALLCPLYKNSLQLTPVFDRAVLEGEFSLRGRVRAAVLVSAALRLLMDRNFRKLLKRLMDR